MRFCSAARRTSPGTQGVDDRVGRTFPVAHLLASVPKCKTGELRFRALVAEGGAERLELARA